MQLERATLNLVDTLAESVETLRACGREPSYVTIPEAELRRFCYETHRPRSEGLSWTEDVVAPHELESMEDYVVAARIALTGPAAGRFRLFNIPLRFGHAVGAFCTPTIMSQER
jgi:hypothetical protein